jgi:hypothetical protein
LDILMIQLWRRITASKLTYQAGAWLLEQLPAEDRSRVFESDYHMAFLSRFMSDMALAQGQGRLSKGDLPHALAMALPKLRSTYQDKAGPVSLRPAPSIRARAQDDAVKLGYVLRGLSPCGRPARRSSAECLSDALSKVKSQFQNTLPAFSALTMCLPLI